MSGVTVQERSHRLRICQAQRWAACKKNAHLVANELRLYKILAISIVFVMNDNSQRFENMPLQEVFLVVRLI